MRLYIEQRKKPDERNYCTPRRRRNEYTCQYKRRRRKKSIGVIQRSTNFESGRCLISSGDVVGKPDEQMAPERMESYC